MKKYLMILLLSAANSNCAFDLGTLDTINQSQNFQNVLANRNNLLREEKTFFDAFCQAIDTDNHRIKLRGIYTWVAQNPPNESNRPRNLWLRNIRSHATTAALGLGLGWLMWKKKSSD